MCARRNCSYVKTFAFSVEGIFAKAENQASQVQKKKTDSCSLALYSLPPLFCSVDKTSSCHITIQKLHFVPLIPIQHQPVQGALEDYSRDLNLYAYLYLFLGKTLLEENASKLEGVSFKDKGLYIYCKLKQYFSNMFLFVFT